MLVDSKGMSVVLIRIHVGDVLIHGPTRQKLSKALKLLFDTTVELRLICQHCKTISPTQQVKFYGFIYDTEYIHNVMIPDNKISQSIAIIDYLTHGWTAHLST